MPKISACIISLNEEEKIEDCLKSLEPVVDEIILVDSNSTDKTIEIASRYTDKIFAQDFLGYVEQRKLAVSKAENDWILSLDCDERLSPELQASILALNDSPETHAAYTLPVRTFYIYRWLDHCWYPDRKIRLFDKRRGNWGGEALHEKIILDSGSTGSLEGDILHYSYDSISQHLQTIDKFTDIAARDLIDKGRHVSILTPLTHACWIFIKLYILKRGFLDGFAGLCVAVLSYVHVFVKYSKVLMHRRRKKTPE